jgi:hypothetical protein
MQKTGVSKCISKLTSNCAIILKTYNNILITVDMEATIHSKSLNYSEHDKQ